MSITEFQIILDLNYGNELNVLKEHANLICYDFKGYLRLSYFFIDSEDGQCYLFDENGKMDDIKKIKTWNGYAKEDIKKILIPNSVESIGAGAFEYCVSLTSIKIPESVKSIERLAFQNCTSLQSIEIPESVESIGHEAFWDCTSLEEVIFKGKTIDQVKAMDWYPWGIEDESIIKCS